MTKHARIALVAIIGLGSLTIMGFSSSSQSISINGYVPLSCRVAFEGGSGVFDANGVAQIGASKEFCNSADGYRVLARASGVDAGSRLVVDGRSYNIISGQEFVIADTQGPAIMNRAISLDAGDGVGGGSLSLRIEAK